MLSLTFHDSSARCRDVEVHNYVKLASVALSCRLLPLQVFASNMEHWQKRRKIFKSIWWVICRRLYFALLADASHAAKFTFPPGHSLKLLNRGSVSENIDRKKAEVFEDIGVEAEDDEDWTQLSDHMPSKKRRL